eukprot:c24909_g1_i1 orf=639-3668(-)
MLDEWASNQSSEIPTEEDNEALVSGPQGVTRKSTNDIITVEELERNPSRNHGAVTSMAAGNNVILVGTDRGWIVRHDFSGIEPLELDLSTSRVGDQSIHRVFIDPGGRHCLAVVRSSTGVENHYIHTKWRKSRVLTKLKGLVINAVAWNRQFLSEAIAREILIGTAAGQLYETSLDEKDKREKPLKLLYDLTELQEPFVSLQMETTGAGQIFRYFIIGVTPTRLYTFTGTGTLEAVFTAYAERVVHFTELPGEMPGSEVHFSAKQRRSEHFAWLAGPGIYHGDLNCGTTNGEESFVENKSLIDYTKFGDGNDVKPCSLALTEFHFLLLYADRLKVVNRVSQRVVEERYFDTSLDHSCSVMLGLCTDAFGGAVYAFNENTIYEITVHDEGRDMWHVYLEMKDYVAALEHCRDALQRDRVYAAQAEAAFSAGDYTRAASFYAKTSSIATFEEIVLKFLKAGDQDALRTFLLRKLDNLGKEDRAQITMVSTWATELYLDKINQLLLDSSKQKGESCPKESSENLEYQKTLKEFRAFLSDCKDVLDEATTLKLLGSYGRVDELVFFAGLKEQHETVIHHYIQQGEAKKALAVLRRPSVSPELLYKFAPALMILDPYETVEYWMTASNLNPRRLIPALMRYSSEPHTQDEPHEAVKYLEFCIQRQQNEDSAVHNLLLSLYAKQDNERSLLRFLETKYGWGRPGRPDIFYDPKYALRLCLKEKRLRACVYIYSMMGMHEEAVALALQIDPELAKAEADKVEDDPDLQKKLWLMVAKHVIQQEKGVERENIQKAITFLKETDGLLKIEDILPFFPDFALIDDFKEAIAASLEDYNRQIEQLKQEMNDATRGADNIRRDISALTQRYAIVDRDEECAACGRGILTQQKMHGRGYTASMAAFYVFPCEHAFHAQCLISHVLKHTDENGRDCILDLQHRILEIVNSGMPVLSGRQSSMPDGDDVSVDSGRTAIDQLRAQLDDAIAGECPYCGELIINEIALPFISSEEQDLVNSWEIKR